MPEHRIRVIMRDTGGGFGQKILVQRDEMCLMLAAPKVGAPVKWVEDRRENLLAAGQVAPRARRRHDGVRRRRRDPGRAHRLRLRLRRVPHAVAGRPGGRGRHAVPRAVPRAPRRLRDQDRSTRTPSGAPRTAARGSSRRSPARCCSTSRRAGWASIPIELRRRNLLRRDDLPYANPNGMTYDNISPTRDVRAGARRCSTTTRSAPSRPRRARPVATSASASPTTSSRRRRATASTRPRRRRSASSRRARSTCTSPAARPGTASRRRSCSSPPTRSA